MADSSRRRGGAERASIRRGGAVAAETRERLEALLAGQRLLALGVVVEGAPVVGLVPYALAADRTALYIQASRLAAHSRGLETGSRWSGVVHEPTRRRKIRCRCRGSCSRAAPRGCQATRPISSPRARVPPALSRGGDDAAARRLRALSARARVRAASSASGRPSTCRARTSPSSPRAEASRAARQGIGRRLGSFGRWLGGQGVHSLDQVCPGGQILLCLEAMPVNAPALPPAVGRGLGKL